MDSRIYLFAALVVYIFAVSLIGYYNRKSSSSEDYFLASRNLPTWLLAITFIASWWGGGSAIDLVNVANRQGISSFWIYGVPVLLSTALMFLLAGGIRRIGTVTQPQLLAKRYDGRAELLLTLFVTIFMVLGSVVQVIVLGQLFASFLGISYAWGATLGCVMVLFYSLFGGFRGVVLTDLFQFVFFLLASLFIFVLTYRQVGGFEPIHTYAETHHLTGFTDFFYNLGDNMAYIITFGTSWMVQANVWQRISAARTPRSARAMMAISFIVFIPLYLMVTLTGVLSRPLYETLPEGGIVAAMLLDMQHPLLSGVIFIGLCSAVMSTMDSMFNTGALTLSVDLYKRYIHPNETPQHMVLAGRLATFVVAALSLLIALRIDSVLTISWIGADFIATGAFVPIVMGFFWQRGTSTAAFATMLFGLCFSLYNLAVAIGAPLPIGWEIASATQAMVGILAALLIYVVTSFLTKEESEKATKFIDEAAIVKDILK